MICLREKGVGGYELLLLRVYVLVSMMWLCYIVVIELIISVDYLLDHMNSNASRTLGL